MGILTSITTVGELIESLAMLDPDTPVAVPTPCPGGMAHAVGSSVSPAYIARTAPGDLWQEIDPSACDELPDGIVAVVIAATAL